ncbi:MAG TPA: TonB-dependent receptor [Bacteroidales bacterium]|jgi:outer membrane receptor protein involved in Fe transport|nr:TonB-dependent receptor [Bacteroidales bacterium]MDI9573990.1 TonB-dependent receptor [Bacteroidota bacterium]MBP9511479.1 TonB-dependent receptor [Bacteroidales bacterium]MBP9589159.1 TonB-dependent receptor [Bacteroidales bacterium]HOE59201.1 TonB-dependent receptor [Bacteroidales bacterium]
MSFNKVLLISFSFIFIFTIENSFAQNTGQGGQSNPSNTKGNLPSQKTGVIKGRIIDQSSKMPLEYANIAIFRKRDSALINGTITNEKGDFIIEKLPFGRFFVKLSFIGYATRSIDSVFITPKQPEVNLGTIRIKLVENKLQGVEITEKRAPVEYNLDKKVYNVDQNIVSMGGTAIDIMQTIPAVQVDLDGNVSLRGSSNVNILIDGRPSNLVSLDQLPSSMVERVEVVTNPSARYDPDGTTGIINIILKKNRAEGINGMVSVNAGTKDKYNASINLNYREKKFNFFTSYNFRQFSDEGTSFSHRETIINDTLSYLDQNGDSRRKGNFHNFTLGADYFIDNYNTLSLSGMYNIRGNDGRENMDNLSTNFKFDTLSLFNRTSINSNDNSGYQGILNYKRTFDDKTKELTADVYYSYSDGNSDNLITQKYTQLPNGLPGELIQQKTISDNSRNMLTAQTDYVTSLWAGRLETGYKYRYSNEDSDYGFYNYDSADGWTSDFNRSNRFKYSESIHAAYLIYTRDITDKLFIQGGLRAEAAQTTSDQVTQDSIFKNDYFSLFPTLHVRYNFNNKNQIQLSYSRRVNRPWSRFLNPFIDYSDPLNLSAGNPALKPEYSNSLELGYTLQFGKTTLTPSVFYTNTSGVISRIMSVDNNGVSFTTFKNQDKSSAAGLEVILAQQFAKWWRLNTNFSYYHAEVDGPDITQQTASSNSWTFRLNSLMSVPRLADIQINFNYNSPMVFNPSIGRHGGGGTQGKMEENYWADLGIKKNFLDGNASISLRLSDIFKTMKFNMTTYGSNFTSKSERTRDSRTLFVGLSYKFNDYKRRQQKLQDMIEELDEF